MKNVTITTLEAHHYDELLDVMKAAYPNWPGAYWRRGTIEQLLEVFPEGQFVALVDDKVVGCAMSIIVDYDKFGDNHTYEQITGHYTFNTHDPKGDVLYGIEVFVHPDYRGLRLGRRLYDVRKELCERLNLRAIVFGGRIPNYHRYADQLTPREYISKVKQKEIHDPVLNFQLSNDFHVKKILRNYMPSDEQSQEHATLLQWDNIYYHQEQNSPAEQRKTYARIGLVQWQMRPYRNLDELFMQAEYFVDTIAAYKGDIAAFPEFFNAPLMAEHNHLRESEAIRLLARHTEEIKERFSELAVRYNVNIVTGSLPEMHEDRLFNVGYFCHRSGKTERYEKMHVTPDEVKYWAITGGSSLRVFDTDVGKVGVLICYDVEFPELSRLLADQGMQILIVPYLTDTQNAYMRVRHCAQSRAIENECYVAITGSVGNLPQVENMDLQYSQSAVLTPCDFAFPYDGVKAVATPNTEMVLVADLDMELLTDLHYNGAVRNLLDRRKDFYQLAITKPKKGKKELASPVS
ncbi:MAG: bifunctional GNAT family N-acetyltransferase/carbon-nitrogen hydrolase family protein [Lewinellaceae bacterium]|nr:bifunctional GNAT family N-acetyltransferase/carbon-nitrogen hydrolase family protein [Lewinellaceae bacterium]MCB9355429.1 bifunctional GNAT family N-acetyltransferase/carbon-nitrogen hydrolase family protein [Lewinellaceae bacterium]